MGYEKSILIGHCPKQNRYWGLVVEKFNGKWEIIDAVPLSEKDGKELISQVNQPSFSVHSNLQACRYDQAAGRVIRSSNRIPCPKNKDVYSYQCIFCKNMDLVFRAIDPTPRVKTIKLSQGQEFKIEIAGRPLEQIELNVGWDPLNDSDYNMDIDSSIVLFRSQDCYDYELVYYANLSDEEGSVEHLGDNLTGEPINGQSDVDEIININLKNVPTHYDTIAIIINIYDCEDREQTFVMVDNLFIRLYDKNSRQQLCNYQVSHNIKNATGLVLGILKRKGNEWVFKATGDASDATSVEDLAEEAIKKY